MSLLEHLNCQGKFRGKCLRENWGGKSGHGRHGSFCLCWVLGAENSEIASQALTTDWYTYSITPTHAHTHTQACPCAHALANTKLSRREIWWDALQDACWLCRYRCRLVWLQQWPASWSKALKFHILWLVNQCQSINIHRCQIRFCQIGHCSQAGLCERTTQVWNCATELLPCNKLPVLILFDRHSRRIDSRTVNPWAPTVNQAVVSCAQARDSC